MQNKKKFIRLFKPSFGNEEIIAIRKLFKKSWIGFGPEVKKFEESWSNYIGINYSVGVTSCSAALHIALASKNFKKRKKVLVPAMTFTATAAAALYCDLEPVFVDINEYDLNINFEDLKKKYTKDCVAVIPVHVGGHPCEMEKIVPWAKKKKLLVIEDCAHTAGGIYKGKMLGTWGDISCFSFEEKKMLTTGDGGMICTNSKNLAKKFRNLSFHGWNRDPWSRHNKSLSTRNLNEKHWYYQIKDLGFKYNMNDLMAAIGQVQLKKLNSFNEKRNNGVCKYLKGIKNCKNIKPFFKNFSNGIAYWMFAVRSKKRDKLISFLKQKGIATSVYWIPVPMHPLYKKYNANVPVTAKVWKELVTLPLFSDIKSKEINFVIKSLKEFDAKE
ncbi:DegT/DnrJ/EryC1/StrS family aminotransferase [Candidatus Pelagibacter sp. HIMB1587]|uniref:DegT/DnrJ/EryC1/StrS family aminotransferase n=1 Tax=Candidatus Pelagibacter sp. HIMB1587 TaxID=3413354 RepID=UPI003F842CDB